MKVTINNTEYMIDGSPPEAAVDLIRHNCGLTGTKQVCGSGVCGACTILVDRTPMVSCLLPAHRLAGRSVQTVEGFGPQNLHPVQKAFMTHDGLQCGYCTPGFIMEGIAFYERWRAEHGSTRPTREEIAEGLAGHLCRCGAYDGIYHAMQSACAGEFDGGDAIPQRVDALEKVTGQAKYTTDIQLEGQLVGKILRSPHPHARVLKIDLATAEAMPGVRAAVALPERNLVMRYAGQPLAAVAAVDEATAQTALDAIRVEYEILPHVIGIDAAMADDAPDIWGRQRRSAPSAGEGVSLPGSWDKNLRTGSLNLGGLTPGRAHQVIDQYKQQNRPVFEQNYTNGLQVHTALEPHCAVAHWQDERRVTVYVSTQGITAQQTLLAERFDLRDEDVTIIAHHVGGGFGAKNSLSEAAVAAVALSRRAKAPVAVIPPRPEEMNLGGVRPGGRFELKVAIGDDYKLEALISHAYSNSGVAVANATAALGAIGYSGGARDLLDHDVVNNQAPGAPFRGPGGPGALWALEQAIDQMAHDRGISPITIRRAWSGNEQLTALCNWVEQLPVWQARTLPATKSARFRRGVGVAFGHWLYLYDPDTTIQLNASPEGFRIRTATQDIGNGVRTTLARIVGAVFGLAPTHVQVEIGDTQYPHGPIAGGSRVTPSVFDPTRQAALQMRERLFGLAAEELDLENAQAEAAGIRHAGGLIPWLDVVKQTPPQELLVRRGGDPQLLQQVGSFVLSRMGRDFMFGNGMSHAAVIVEVEVDTLLGKTRVLNVWEKLAIGTVHVPDMARSQVYGGIIQGIGFALYEEKVLDVISGQNLTSNLQDYRIPAIGDIPEMHVEFLDYSIETAKGGGIGMSELATIPVSAAVANAVFNACGVRCIESPIKPERLILALSTAGGAA